MSYGCGSGCLHWLYQKQKSLVHVCADLANKLLRVSTKCQRIQDNFWSALSERLMDLSVILALQGPEPLGLEVLSQLSNLTNLVINMGGDADQDRCDDGDEVADSHAVSLPRLKSLHMEHVITEDLSLQCPKLRSLQMEDCRIRGNLILPACLEEFSVDRTPAMHDASAVRNLLALTSLAYYVAGDIEQDLLYGFLPLMPVLRNLDLKVRSGQLPPQLPVSLQVVKYSLCDSTPLSSGELQHFAGACQLPALQSISLSTAYPWLPWEVHALQEIVRTKPVTRPRYL